MWRFCLLEFLDVERSDDPKTTTTTGKENNRFGNAVRQGGAPALQTSTATCYNFKL